MSSLRDFLIFRGRRAPDERRPDTNADEMAGPKPSREYLAPITPTRPVRTAVSLPQGISHNTRELAKASRLDGFNNANRPRR